jgi:hypothetical protein
MRETQHRARLEATLRQLAAAGSWVDFSVAKIPEENAEVEIQQVGGIHDSPLCELPAGRAGYILDLEIVNQTSKAIHCSHTELRMPWQDALFDWLPDPKDTGMGFSYFRRKRNGAVSASKPCLRHTVFPAADNWNTRETWSLTIFCLRVARPPSSLSPEGVAFGKRGTNASRPETWAVATTHARNYFIEWH